MKVPHVLTQGIWRCVVLVTHITLVPEVLVVRVLLPVMCHHGRLVGCFGVAVRRPATQGLDSVAAFSVAPQGPEAFEPLSAALASLLAMEDFLVDLKMSRRLATFPAIFAIYRAVLCLRHFLSFLYQNQQGNTAPVFHQFQCYVVC